VFGIGKARAPTQATFRWRFAAWRSMAVRAPAITLECGIAPLRSMSSSASMVSRTSCDQPTFAPAPTGRIIADLIAGRKPNIDNTPFRPG